LDLSVIFIIFVAASCLWVLFDSSNECRDKGLPYGYSVVWFFACAALWIVAFPLYITKRGQLEQDKFSPSTMIIIAILLLLVVVAIWMNVTA
jgi:hypothetical protein